MNDAELPDWAARPSDIGHARARRSSRMGNVHGATITSLLDQYLRERRTRHELTASSRANARYTLHDLARFLGDRPVQRITQRDLERWLASRHHMAATTQASRFGRVRAFFRWAVLAGHARTDPTLGVVLPRRPRTLPRQLRDDQVALIFAHAADSRMCLILLLMWRLGLRCCEVAGLTWEQVDLTERIVRIHGKGGHVRLLPLTDDVIEALELYAREAGMTRVGPVVRSFQRPSAGITTHYVSDLAAKVAKEAGVHQSRDGRTGHALRHTRAGRMVRRGAHIRTVQTFLGHSQLSSTQVYLPYADVEHIRPWLEDDDPPAA